MTDHEEFKQIFESLTVSGLRQRVNGLLMNQQINQERFCDLYQLYEHNLGNQKEGQKPLQADVVMQIEQTLAEEQQKGGRNGFGAKANLSRKNVEVKGASGPIKHNAQGTLNSLLQAGDVFDSLTQEKKAKVERKRQRMVEEEKENTAAHPNSKAGKKKVSNVPQVGYNQRPDRGKQKAVYNEGVNKIPGLYNSEGRVVVKLDNLPVKIQMTEPTTDYQFYNLNAQSRTNAMHDHFELMEDILKKQCGVEAFNEFYSPQQTLQRVCGRVVNLSNEDPKMKDESIGLFNINYDLQCKLKLNMQEIKQYALYEGEVIVAEGFMDTKKLNVTRIVKPTITPTNDSYFTMGQLEQYQKNYQGKAVQIMVASGPFTVNNELSYAALKDLMAVVQKDKPHALILSGPFVSQSHEDIQNGDLKYFDPESDSHEFLDYDQLFDKVITYVYNNLGDLKGKMEVIVVPSHNDVTHLSPMPQPPFSLSSMPLDKKSKMPHLVGNPSFFMLNDISVGFVNVDVIRDMCVNFCTKFEITQEQMAVDGLAQFGGIQQQNANGKPKPPQKIDQVLYSILQQHNLYPLYPPGNNSPIEVEHIQNFMFERTPDIIITPSDLLAFAKNISGCICINPGYMCKGSSGGSYASITIDPLVLASSGLDFNNNLQNEKMSNRAKDRIRVDIHNI